jgi:carbon monoxide dehydrogenase subunit G
MAVIMKLASTFNLPAAPDKVLSLFLDPTTMQACIPGCEDLVQVDENHYQGTLANEVAHVKFKASFSAEITSTTAPADTTEPAVVRAVLKGEDRRLGSTIKIDATLTVAPLTRSDSGDTSSVAYELEMAMWGKLGRLGEAVIRRRTIEVEKQFAEALTAICAGQPVPARVDKRAARRPASDQSVEQPATQPRTATSPAGRLGAAPVVQPAEVADERSREDWVVLGLAVAAAFAYGVILGGRKGARR